VINDSTIVTKKTFYKDGTSRTIIQYKNGNPYNVELMKDSLGINLNYGNLKDGTGLIKFYDNKNRIHSEAEYQNCKRDGKAVLYSEGKITSIEHFVNDLKSGEFQKFFDGRLSIKGNYLNNSKVDNWLYYDYNNTLTTKNFTANPDTTKETTINYEYIYFKNHTNASFQGGELGLMNFIRFNIVYPQLSKESGISGTVYVTFEIDKEGKIITSRILKGRAADLDAQALYIVNQMPVWSPAFANGLPVNVQFNLPIKYTLR
jgi:TonB family protein